MNHGLYVSASGLMTNLYRQDILANNLANASTVGFKRDLATMTQRDAESIEDSHAYQYRHPMMDELGGGVFAGPQSISFEPGALEKTSNALDLALESPDTFFAVQRTNPATGQEEIRLTRDGRFMRNAEGFLVTATGGFKVLDEANQPIQLDDDQPAVIDPDARVQQNNAEVARIQVVAMQNRERLIKDGHNLFKQTGSGDGRVAPVNGRVRPGFVEASAVDPIRELLGLMETTSAIQYNSNLIKYHDTLMERAVNSLGRVAG